MFRDRGLGDKLRDVIVHVEFCEVEVCELAVW